jgi:hypothetical protein
MSNAALKWAFRTILPSTAKSVLVALADHSNEQDEAWPSVARLERWTGLKDRAIRLALRQLEACNAINRCGKNGTTVIYKLEVGAEINPAPRAEYNPASDATNPARHAVNPAPHADKPLLTPIKPKKSSPLRTPPNGKCEASEREAMFQELFAAFWAAYPRKVGKGQAQRAFRAAIKKIPADRIIVALCKYPFDMSRPEFIPHASTWLNGERWTDEIQPLETDEDRLYRAAGLEPPRRNGRDLDGEVMELFPRLVQ